jgi:hypothetical protein
LGGCRHRLRPIDADFDHYELIETNIGEQFTGPKDRRQCDGCAEIGRFQEM